MAGGKRGRPVGSRNKPGTLKPGPKADDGRPDPADPNQLWDMLLVRMVPVDDPSQWTAIPVIEGKSNAFVTTQWNQAYTRHPIYYGGPMMPRCTGDWLDKQKSGLIIVPAGRRPWPPPKENPHGPDPSQAPD